MTHPSRTLPFRELVGGLTAANEAGLVNVQRDGDLALYTYSKSAVYERVWTPFTEMARGLILDLAAELVMATPFPKFFNVGERPEIPALPFEVFEKLDGSLIIAFHDGTRWRAATKGSFKSEQAQWAQERLAYQGTDDMHPGWTYLFEYVGPENKIVVHYDESELILLGVYNEQGLEAIHDTLTHIGWTLGVGVAARYSYDSIADLMAIAGSLPANMEGFVIRFSNGYRLKVKGDEYCRLHRLVSNVTPLAIWEAMAANDKVSDIRRELPEEFWGDFDAIHDALSRKVDAIVSEAKRATDDAAHLSDKDIGLRLNEYPEHIRGFIFPLRKHGDFVGRARTALYRAVRPTGNRLEGYQPSSAMQRVEEAA